MTQLDAEQLIEPVADACIEANRALPADVMSALEQASAAESGALGREVLRTILENAQTALRCALPTCQDTGTAVVFVELGRELCLQGDLCAAIDEGVRRGYQRGWLRPSMLRDPIARGPNTGDNTPAVVHLQLVDGDRLRLHVVPKGGGAENMSALWMLRPADGAEGIIEAVVGRIREARGRPCPPLILGIGVGATFEKTALLAKQALLRRVGEPHPNIAVAELEREILGRVNATGIGPMGLGGDTTALAVHVLTHPCHIASLPVALNVQCHAARHVTLEFPR